MATVYIQMLPPGQEPRSAAHALISRVLGASDETLVYGPSGKPMLPGGPEFSLSHTKGAVVLAVDRAPVGVDVERIRPVFPKLPLRVMSSKEYAWFSARGSQPEDFFTLWTLKESYYKALGTGLPGIPDQTKFVLEDGIWRLPDTDFSFFTWEKEQLRIAVCSYAQQVEFLDIT